MLKLEFEPHAVRLQSWLHFTASVSDLFYFLFFFFTFCNNPFICNIPKVLHLIYFKKRYTTVSAL